MEIALVNPPVTHAAPQAPLGLMLLKASISKNHGVTILDLNFRGDRERLKSLRADIVGISCMTPQRDTLFTIAEKLRMKNTTVVAGGPHPTIAPMEMLQRPCIDFVIRGEGEVAFQKLIDSLEKDLPLEDVKGLGFKVDNLPRLNPIEQIKDLNTLPFPSYDSIDLRRYPVRNTGWTLEVPFETTRGCPHKCIFCCVNWTRGDYREMSLSRVSGHLDRILELYSKETILLNLFDNNFTFSKERVAGFCQYMSNQTCFLRSLLNQRARP